MKCPVYSTKMSRKAGQMPGTGLARAYRERDIVPVPSPSRYAPEMSRFAVAPGASDFRALRGYARFAQMREAQP